MSREASREGHNVFATAAALAAVVAMSGCVTSGKYDELVTERNALASKNEGLVSELEALRGEVAAAEAQSAAMQGTFDTLVGNLREELSTGEVQIEQLRDGIRLNVESQVLFASGSSQLGDRGKEVLAKVAKELDEAPYTVLIEGHTDNVQISAKLRKTYTSNWELAAARASRVGRFLQENGVEGERLRVVSYGPFHPITSNDSPEGRAKNRRIEIRMIPAAS